MPCFYITGTKYAQLGNFDSPYMKTAFSFAVMSILDKKDKYRRESNKSQYMRSNIFLPLR